LACISGPRRDGDDLAFRVGEAEKRGDVVAHLGEGVAAQLPRLIELVEPIEAGALVADHRIIARPWSSPDKLVSAFPALRVGRAPTVASRGSSGIPQTGGLYRETRGRR